MALKIGVRLRATTHHPDSVSVRQYVCVVVCEQGMRVQVWPIQASLNAFTCRLARLWGHCCSQSSAVYARACVMPAHASCSRIVWLKVRIAVTDLILAANRDPGIYHCLPAACWASEGSRNGADRSVAAKGSLRLLEVICATARLVLK